jgi:quercetin dioxygenase-like cupin family protein
VKGRSVVGIALSSLLAAGAFAQQAVEEKPKAAGKAAPYREVTWSSDLMQWKDISENVPGVKVVDLWGDRLHGAFSSLIKLPAGYSLPLHVHTADLRIVVVSGALVHRSEGKPEIRLPSGSYLVEPAGLRHATTCDPATDCVVFVEGDRKFDMNLVDAPKAPAKK